MMVVVANQNLEVALETVLSGQLQSQPIKTMKPSTSVVLRLIKNAVILNLVVKAYS